MKLIIKDKNELRKVIEDKLSNYDLSNGKIVLDNEILDELLFEKITMNDEENIKVKLPVWSGEFLTKIDLSKIDFEDVSWDILFNNKSLRYYIDNYSKKTADRIDSIHNNLLCKCIDYSNTNANIDLTSSFEAKYNGSIELSNCNFSNLDFSNIDLSNINSIELFNSNISNTNLNIPNFVSMSGCNSDLSNINLSGRNIYFSRDFSNIPDSLLNNTNININMKLRQYIDKELLKRCIKNNWQGCYLNGKRIYNADEIKTIKKNILNEYNDMKNNIFNNVSNDINKQMYKKLKK